MTNSNVAEFSAIPKPDGHIYDPNGDTLNPRKEAGWMVRADAKAAEKLELHKGTIAVIAIAPALLTLLFTYGAAALGWARDDQSQKEQLLNMKGQVDETRSDVKELNRKFDEIQKTLQEQAIQDAKIQGFKAGVAETQSDKGSKK